MVYFKIRRLCISQENQVGYDSGGGTIAFIGWIKFLSFEKHFSFLGLVVSNMALTRCLNLHWEMHLPATCSI